MVFSYYLLARLQNLKGHYCQPSLSVSLSVCLWPALLPFNVNRFRRNLVTRTLLWSCLAATIMVQIGRRGTARRLCENFEKFSKITVFEFQNSGPPFFASMSPVYCKKNLTRSEQNWRGDTFWSLPFRQPPTDHCVLRQYWRPACRRCSSSGSRRCADSEMLHPHHSADPDQRSANWEHSELGAQSGRKNPPACIWFNYVCQQRLHRTNDDSDQNNVSCIIAKADYSQYVFGSKHDVMLPASTLWRNAISHILRISRLANTCTRYNTTEFNPVWTCNSKRKPLRMSEWLLIKLI